MIPEILTKFKKQLSDRELLATKLVSAYKETFMLGDGPLVLRDILSQAYLDSSTFDPDPIISAYNQGKRDLVLGILSVLNTKIDDILTENVTLEEIL